MTNKEKLQERRDRILGRKQTFQLYVVLYSQEKKLDPLKKEERKQTELPKGAKTRKISGHL